MPLFGAHLSVAGGLHKAVEAAVALGCDTVQVFTKSPSAWHAPALAEDSVNRFRAACESARLEYLTAHDSYLINLASPDDPTRRRSITAFRDELLRAEALGLSFLVTHPGAHLGSGEANGIARVVAALDEVRRSCPALRVRVLLETTAGQGSYLGGRFEHLRAILDGVADRSWLGVCFDTCHVFAAGYPLRTDADYSATFAEFDRVIGLDELKLFHLNDSVREQGSRVDRHAALGEGQIGPEAFRRLVNDPRFRNHPMILETPKQDERGREMDPVNLGRLRGWVVTTPG